MTLIHDSFQVPDDAALYHGVQRRTQFLSSCLLSGEHMSAEVVAIAGHLGILVTLLMTGAWDSPVAMSKRGAVFIEFSSRVIEWSGALEWLLPGSQVCRIGQGVAA